MAILSYGFFYKKYPEETNSWGRNKTGNYQRMEERACSMGKDSFGNDKCYEYMVATVQHYEYTKNTK